MHRILIFIAVLGLLGPIWADDVHAELQKVAQVHKSIPSYKVSTTYRLYENFTSMNAIEVHKGIEYKQGNLGMSCLAGVTTLYTKQDYLLIDSAENQILLTDKPESIKNLSSVGLNFDSLQKKFSSIELKVIDQKLKVITLKTARKGNQVSDMEKIMLYYDAATYHIKKVVLYYAFPADVKNQMREGDKPRIEISYADYQSPLSAQELATLRREHYVSIKKGKVLGVGLYAQYEIIDGRYRK